MKPPFLGRRFNNLFNRRRPTLRSLRTFYTRTALGEQAHESPKPKDPRRRKKRFLYSRVAEAWYNTPTKWYPLPLGIGIALLAALQFTKNRERWYAEGNPFVLQDEHGEVVKLKGPWQVHVLGALPLRNLSRLWGWMNAIELPLWFRPTGYKIYSWIFGCNIDEVENDLTVYRSLGEFFYRRLKPGVRPIAGTALVSPADGTILHFGTIDADHGPDAEENDKKQPIRIEQVKGVSYSLDALLGISTDQRKAEHVEFSPRESAELDDRHFANVNGIEYSLDQLLGSKDGAKEGQSQDGAVPQQELSSGAGAGPGGDASSKDNQRRQSSVLENMVRDSSVAVELGQQSIPSSPPPLLRRTTSGVKPGNQLHFAVIYLAPGDYHRFHSPTAWVVEKRRHFTGELFSVSPYIARRLSNLFVLNERVVLLGRWKHGFFSMVPVGATNVGSIKVNFDKTLRTNLPQRPAPPSPGTYAEATYASASALLRGQPMIAGQEMGGFCLGSTIVLVFEAPKGFEFSVHAGQKVKVGQAMVDIRS